MDRADQFRRLIAEYRKRLEAGVDSSTVHFILQQIKEAERELEKIEGEQREAAPDPR